MENITDLMDKIRPALDVYSHRYLSKGAQIQFDFSNASSHETDLTEINESSSEISQNINRDAEISQNFHITTKLATGWRIGDENVPMVSVQLNGSYNLKGTEPISITFPNYGEFRDQQVHTVKVSGSRALRLVRKTLEAKVIVTSHFNGYVDVQVNGKKQDKFNIQDVSDMPPSFASEGTIKVEIQKLE